MSNKGVNSDNALDRELQVTRFAYIQAINIQRLRSSCTSVELNVTTYRHLAGGGDGGIDARVLNLATKLRCSASRPPGKGPACIEQAAVWV